MLTLAKPSARRCPRRPTASTRVDRPASRSAATTPPAAARGRPGGGVGTPPPARSRAPTRRARRRRPAPAAPRRSACMPDSGSSTEMIPSRSPVGVHQRHEQCVVGVPGVGVVADLDVGRERERRRRSSRTRPRAPGRRRRGGTARRAATPSSPTRRRAEQLLAGRSSPWTAVDHEVVPGRPEEVDHDRAVAERLGDRVGDRVEDDVELRLVTHGAGHVEQPAQASESLEIVLGFGIEVDRGAGSILYFCRPVRKTLELLAVAVVVAVTAGCGGGPSAEQMPGDARALAVAPDFAGTLWEAIGADAYRTQNGGRSWQRVPSAATATVWRSPRSTRTWSGRTAASSPTSAGPDRAADAHAGGRSSRSPRRTTRPTGCTRWTVRAACG